MSLLEAIGQVSWWGLTPAVDFSTYCTNNKKDKLRILTVGASDLRHVIQTMPCDREVEVFMLETNLEQYCRDIMLLSVVLQPPDSMGLQEKTELYLDLFGNSLVRSNSMKFVRSNVTSYIRMVTDEDYLHKVLPMLDLSLLKYKERDFMEAIFKFWAGTSPYEIDKLWDNRVRKHLGDRYDAGRNVFDMDFSMKLKERAQLLDFGEYSNWRWKGISYEVRDGVFDAPNRTLSSGIVAMRGGEKQLLRGYWGDIVSSPYISHGIHTTLKSMYEVRNRVNVRTGSEVAEYNVMGLIYHINTGHKYTEPPKPDRFTFAAKPEEKEKEVKPATLEEITEEEEEEEEEQETEVEKEEKIEDKLENLKIENNQKHKKDLLQLHKPHSKLKIKFLQLGTAAQLPKKQNLLNSFDLIYFSTSQVSYFTPEITALLKEDANVLVENVKYIPSLTKEQEEKYLPKIKEYARNAKCEHVGANEVNSNNFHFSYHRTS